MHIIEGEVGRLPVPADQVDDDIAVPDGLSDRVLVAQIERLEKNLSQIAGALQASRLVLVTAVRQDHLGANLAQLVADVASQKSGATENCRHHSIEAGSAAGTALHRGQVRVGQLTDSAIVRAAREVVHPHRNSTNIVDLGS